MLGAGLYIHLSVHSIKGCFKILKLLTHLTVGSFCLDRNLIEAGKF